MIYLSPQSCCHKCTGRNIQRLLLIVWYIFLHIWSVVRKISAKRTIVKMFRLLKNFSVAKLECEFCGQRLQLKYHSHIFGKHGTFFR